MKSFPVDSKGIKCYNEDVDTTQGDSCKKGARQCTNVKLLNRAIELLSELSELQIMGFISQVSDA